MYPSIYHHWDSLCARLTSAYLFIKERLKKLLAHPFCGQAASLAGLLPEAMLPKGLGNRRNTSAVLGPIHLHRCLGSKNMWRQMFSVLSDTGCQAQSPTGHEESRRKAERLSKNWIHILLITFPSPGPKKWSSSGYYIVSPGREEWMGIGGGRRVLRRVVSSPLYLWHTEGTARVFRRYLESWQWDHRQIYKDMALCLAFPRQCGIQGGIKCIYYIFSII